MKKLLALDSNLPNKLVNSKLHHQYQNLVSHSLEM